jgi:hypothetical protein
MGLASAVRWDALTRIERFGAESSERTEQHNGGASVGRSAKRERTEQHNGGASVGRSAKRERTDGRGRGEH